MGGLAASPGTFAPRGATLPRVGGDGEGTRARRSHAPWKCVAPAGRGGGPAVIAPPRTGPRSRRAARRGRRGPAARVGSAPPPCSDMSPASTTRGQLFGAGPVISGYGPLIHGVPYTAVLTTPPVTLLECPGQLTRRTDLHEGALILTKTRGALGYTNMLRKVKEQYGVNFQ